MVRWLAFSWALIASSLLGGGLVRAETLLSQSFESRALNGPMRFSIYLPPGYGAPDQADRRYPVVYLLHGVGDDERAWPTYGKVEETLDRLVEAGDLPPFIVAMPNGLKSWWIDSRDLGGPGDYGTAIRDDLPAYVEANWRAMTTRDGRFVAGLSMGGYGALRLGFANPERYRAVGAMSSALWNRVVPGWQPSDPDRMTRIFSGSFGEPFDAQRFFDRHPRRFLPRIKTLDEPLGIYLEAGDDDTFGAQIATLDLFEELRDLQIPTELRIDDGGHEWKVWRAALGPMMQWFAALAKPAGG